MNPAAASPGSQPLPQRSVLVVDDVPEILDLFKGLARRVRNYDLRLTTEVNSSRALELASKQRFDLVLTDFRMRQVDGIEVLQAARRYHPEGLRVLMTGYNEVPTDLSRIEKAGVDAYLQKPLKSQDILLLLLDFLGRNEQTIATCRAHARELEKTAMKEERSLGLA